MKNSVLVLLSAYNGEKYIAEQIESILNQETEYNVDLLIRDDGSSDGTCKILNLYEQKYPDRVKVIYGQNYGYIKSFFELIKVAEQHKYYALCDQDDVWLPNKISAAVQMCDKKEETIPFLYGSSSFLTNEKLEKIGETQKKLRDITFYNTVIQNIFPGHTQVFNEALRQLLINDIDYSKIYVHDSWIANMAILKGQVYFDNTSYTLYRQHGSNEVGFGKGSLGWIKERLKRIKKNDNMKYSIQIHYMYEKEKDYLTVEQRGEMERFINSQNSWLSRLGYVLTTKMYRQKKFETILFKLLYFVGGYKV